MPLFGNNLEDILGQQTANNVSGLQDQFAQTRRRAIGRLGSTGRLRSGVGNYDLTNLDTNEASGIGDEYSKLTSALGSIPAENYSNERQYGRNLSLAELIGELSKPSALEQALGALSTAGKVAGTIAAF